MNSYRINNNNLTSLINFPILIDDHLHPLILCNSLRGRNCEGWVCDKCSSNYSSITPSFYCTFCDYDLCQNCLGEYKLKSIRKYNCKLINNINAKNNKNDIFPWQIDYPNHKHFMSHVKKMNDWFCESCKQISIIKMIHIAALYVIMIYVLNVLKINHKKENKNYL